MVSENGENLSSGQKQRLAIARALLQRNTMIIFDESTSAIDSVTEKSIMNKLLSDKRTLIFITHNLNVANQCDRICVLNDGTILEEGSPDDLINNTNSYYNKLLLKI